MHALVINDEIVKYPYSIGMLRRDNPQTSFPKTMSDERLRSWGMIRVQLTERPAVDIYTRAVEGAPVWSGDVLVQTWRIETATPQQVDEAKAAHNARADEARRSAYAAECDPLFFKWQRGEATKDDWLASIDRVKSLFPKID